LHLPETATTPAGAAGDYRQVLFGSVTRDGRHALLALQRIARTPLVDQPGWTDNPTGACRLECWDLDQAQRLRVWNEADDEPNLLSLTLVEEGQFAVTHNAKGYKIWTVPDGKVTFEQDWPVPAPLAKGVLFTPDRRYLASYRTGEQQAAMMFRDTNTALEIREIRTAQLVQRLELTDWSSPNTSWPLALHREADWLAADNHKGGLELYSLKTGKLWAYWTPHDGAPFSATFSPDGQLLVTASEGSLRLWPLPLLRREVEELERP
jgi:WD40 repeat protein